MKLLVVAYNFPPDGSVAAFRVTKFVKYLSRMGWTIRVITVRERYYRSTNRDSLQDVQNVEIVRTRRLSKPVGEVRAEGLFWLPILLPQLLRQIRLFKPDILFFTGGAFLQWVAAPICKMIFRVPYVLDFRDPWKLNPYLRKVNTITNSIYNWLSTVLEPPIVQHSDLVINVTEPATEMYRQHYPNCPPGIFRTIPNGFDPEDLVDLEEPIHFTPCDIVYVGKFGDFRDPTAFLEGFKAFVESRSLSPQDCRFVWVGNPEAHVLDMIHQNQIGSYCESVGFKPYQEALRYVKGARCCLLISGHHAYEPTTKVFDYIALEKPILALLGSQGFLSDFLLKYPLSKVGVSCGPDQVLDLLNQIYSQSEWGIDAQQLSDLRSSIDRRDSAVVLSKAMVEIISQSRWRESDP